MRWAGRLAPADYRRLLRRARVFVTAPRREDYGISQLEALAEGCMLVTTAAPGPYAALPIARELDPRLVGDDIAAGLAAALDDARAGYAERAHEALEPYSEEAVDLYRARSPVHFTDRLERPLLLLQGLDDEVVPPTQAQMLAEALDHKCIPHAYIAFEGEGHGFRKQENVRRSIEATLDFVGRVFGFQPADDLEPLAIAHL